MSRRSRPSLRRIAKREPFTTEESDVDSENSKHSDYVEVPPSALSHGALVGLVEEFITREGTDYGAREYTLAEKRASVMRLIDEGEVAVYFDTNTQTATLKRR